MLPQKTAPSRPIYESYWVLPGQFLAGEHPAVAFEPEITRKRILALLKTSFNTFIDLTVAGETTTYEPLLNAEALALNVRIRYCHFPINDFELPAPAQMNAILSEIDAAIVAGGKVYLHCYGGIGRTGTVVGCYLVRHGKTGEQALQQLAEWWQLVPKSDRYPHTPETLLQEQFVRDWKKHDLR